MFAARQQLLGLKIAAPTIVASVTRQRARTHTTMSASSYKYVVLGGGNAAGCVAQWLACWTSHIPIHVRFMHTMVRVLMRVIVFLMHCELHQVNLAMYGFLFAAWTWCMHG